MTNPPRGSNSPGTPGIDLGVKRELDFDPRQLTGGMPTDHKPRHGSDDNGQNPETAPAPQTRVQLEPSPLAIVPTKGWAARQYEKNRKNNVPDPDNPQYLLVPSLGTKEQAERDAMMLTLHEEALDINQQYDNRMLALHEEALSINQTRDAEISSARFWYRMSLLITRLQALVSTPDLRVNIVVSNIKGTSGKSARAIGIGSAISWFGGRSMLLIPATLNTSIGDAGTMSGIPTRNLARISDIYEKLDKINTPEDLANNIPTTVARLFVIAEDQFANAPGRKTMTAEMLFEITDKLSPLVYGGLVLDMGNDGISDNNFVFGVVDRGTVIVFSALANSAMSREKMSVSIDGLRTAPDNFGVNGQTNHVSIQRKVAHSIVVLNGVAPGEVIDFDEFTMSAQQGANAPTSEAFAGQTMTVPVEQTLLTTSAAQKIVYNPFVVNKATLMADLEEAVACYEQGAKLLGINIDHTESLEPDFDTASVLLGINVRGLAAYNADGLKKLPAQDQQ